MTARPCEICGGDLPARNPRFCKTECRKEGWRRDERERRAREKMFNLVNKEPKPCHRVGCGETLPPPSAKGGHQKYCSPECKRLVDNERKRTDYRAAPIWGDYSGQNIPDHIAGKFGALVSFRVI